MRLNRSRTRILGTIKTFRSYLTSVACLVAGRIELPVTHLFDVRDLNRLNFIRACISARVLPEERLKQYAQYITSCVSCLLISQNTTN